MRMKKTIIKDDDDEEEDEIRPTGLLCTTTSYASLHEYTDFLAIRLSSNVVFWNWKFRQSNEKSVLYRGGTGSVRSDPFRNLNRLGWERFEKTLPDPICEF